MWLTWYNRFDIVFIIARLSQYNSDPRQRYTKNIKHFLRYFKGALELILTHKENLNDEKREFESIGFVKYTDNNYVLES